MISEQHQVEFITAVNRFSDDLNNWADRQGFWPPEHPVDQFMISSKIALTHGELSEALESVRHGNPPDDKISQFSGLEAELADTVIRILDLARKTNCRLAEAIIAKQKYNETRPFRNGKNF